MAGVAIPGGATAQVADLVAALREPSTTPVPFPALEQLRELFHADAVGFTSLDSTQPRVVFEQYVDFMSDLPDPRGWGFETETVEEARRNPFWERYWDPARGCSYPDRTGDYDWVHRASDTASLRERRASPRYDPAYFTEGVMTVCFPGSAPGRYTRFRLWRSGVDFTDDELVLLTLLKPHIELPVRAWLAMQPPPLTARQLEVLRMVAAGRTNRQIARHLRVSEGTVHVHLTNIYRRLGVHGRAAAVHAVADSLRFARPAPVRPEGAEART